MDFFAAINQGVMPEAILQSPVKEYKTDRCLNGLTDLYDYA